MPVPQQEKNLCLHHTHILKDTPKEQHTHVVVFVFPCILKTHLHEQECGNLRQFYMSSFFQVISQNSKNIQKIYEMLSFSLVLLRPVVAGAWKLPFSPGFPFTVNQKVVEQEEDTFLDVAG